VNDMSPHIMMDEWSGFTSKVQTLGVSNVKREDLLEENRRSDMATCCRMMSQLLRCLGNKGDTCHHSFQDTSTVVTSYDIKPPRPFDDFPPGDLHA